MKDNQPPPVGAPIAFGGEDPPPEGDYYVPPPIMCRRRYGAAAQPAPPRHPGLDLHREFPLGYCSLGIDEFALRPSWPLALHLGLLIATFCLPLFVLGRNGARSAGGRFWGALALLGLTIP